MELKDNKNRQKQEKAENLSHHWMGFMARSHLFYPYTLTDLARWPTQSMQLTIASSSLASLSVYSTSGHMGDAIEFICGIYIAILPPLMHIKWFRHMVFMWHLNGIIVTGTYFAVVWEINASYLIFDKCSNVRSIYRQHKKCSGTYMCNMAGISAQGPMPVMFNVSISVLIVTLLIVLSWY